MRSARHFSLILRLVLAWFVLSLGASVASPLVKPQDILLVCTGSGAMKVLVKAADGGDAESVLPSMDCPLCASAVALPPGPNQVFAIPPSGQPVPAVCPISAVVLHTAAPPPARGPPFLS